MNLHYSRKDEQVTHGMHTVEFCMWERCVTTKNDQTNNDLMQCWTEFYSKLKEYQATEELDESFVGITRIGIILFGLYIGSNTGDGKPKHALTYIEREEERNLAINQRQYIPRADSTSLECSFLINDVQGEAFVLGDGDQH